MRKAFLLVLCTVAALTVRSYAQTHTRGGAVVSSTGLGKGTIVLDVSTFPGSTMDAKLQACINAIASAGTCDARAIKGTQAAASALNVNKSVTILWGAVNYQTGSLGSAVHVTADDVTFTGLGIGKTTIGTSVLYKCPIEISAKNFGMTGISVVGPNPNYSGIVNTSETSVTWVSGSTNFANLISGNYIMIGSLLTPYQIATVNSSTSLTLSTSAGNQTAVAYRVNPYSGNVSISGTSVTWLSGSKFVGLSRNLGGGINFGSPGSYTDHDASGNELKIQAVDSDTSLTLAAAPSCGDQSSIPYSVSWDVNGTIGLACSGCQNIHLSNNEFTGWSHAAIVLGGSEAHAIISGNYIHDNPGEGITVYEAGVSSFNLVTNNQMDYNGLSCFDTNARFDTFSNSKCSYTGWANKSGDAVGIQIHGSDNTVDGVTVDFSNLVNVVVAGSNITINNVHACGATGAYYGAGYTNAHGFLIAGTSRTHAVHDQLKNSISCNNTGQGVLIGYADQTIIEGNQVYGNGNVGINVQSTNTNTTVAKNVVTGNTTSYPQINDGGVNTLQISNRVGPSSRMRP